MATTASVYNFSRTNRQILRRHRKDRPSLVLHLHNSHFRFERQNGMFLFDSPVKAFLHFIREQKVPADLVDVLTDSGVHFFEGCLIVEVHDHRSNTISLNSSLTPSHLHSLANGPGGRQPRITPGSLATSAPANSASSSQSLFYLQEGGRYGAKSVLSVAGPSGSIVDGKHGGIPGVEIYCIVLHPTAETLWSDLKMLDVMAGGVWSDQEALEVEAKLLSLTAPPLCLSPDPQATRIANLMLSSTAPPSAYAPSASSPLPFHRNAGKKRGANSIETEKEEASRQRREKIMRMMEGGLKSSAPMKLPNGAMPGAVAASAQAVCSQSKAFVPTFGRMAFIERWRMGRDMAADPMGAQASAAGSKDDASGKASAANGSGDKSEPAKKPPPKKKKKAQREKEEAEAAAAAAEAKKKEEEAAAAAAAAAASKKDGGKGLSKKKKAQLAKEEKERKEKEEKEKAEREKEEKEKKDKAAAGTAATAKKGGSKKKKKDDAAAAAAGAAANGDKSVAGSKNPSPTKGKAGAINGDAASSPAKPDATAAATATAGKKPAAASKKPAAKKPAASKATKAKASPSKSKVGDATAAPDGAMSAATPAATASVQSTPTMPHAMPNAAATAQQQAQAQAQAQAAAAAMFMQQQQQQQQQGAMGGNPFYGMPMMNGSAPMFGANGMGMMAGGQQPGAGMGMGLNMGMIPPNGAQQQQQQQGSGNAYGVAGLGGLAGFHGLPMGMPPTQQQQQQQGGQNGQGQGAQAGGTLDLPVGVGLAGLGNWGNSS